MTLTIDAHENRDVMSADVPNAFIQTKMPEVKEGEERVMKKITGVLVDMLIQLDPHLYGPHVVYDRSVKSFMYKCCELYMVCLQQSAMVLEVQERS